MSRTIRRSVCAFVVVAVVIPLLAVYSRPSIAGQAKPDADRPAEFKPLDRWLGQWDMEMTVKPTPSIKNGVIGKFVTTVSWDLNGRFLRCDGRGQSVAGGRAKVDESFLWMCTYDPQRKEYRSWVFWSTAGAAESPAGNWGSVPVGSGTWDEAAKTLTTRSEDKEAGTTSLSITRWIDGDHHEFVTTVKDAQGQVMMEQVGKLTRRK